MQPFAQVVKTLWGERIVVPLPRELSLEVTTGSQGLAGFDDLYWLSVDCSMGSTAAYIEVLGVNFIVLWKVEVLLGGGNALCIEVSVVRDGDNTNLTYHERDIHESSCGLA